MFFVLSGHRGFPFPAWQLRRDRYCLLSGPHCRKIHRFRPGRAVTHASPEIRRYFGLALIPQAGVSIGLAVLGQRMLPAESGQLLSTIILSSGLCMNG